MGQASRQAGEPPWQRARPAHQRWRRWRRWPQWAAARTVGAEVQVRGHLALGTAGDRAATAAVAGQREHHLVRVPVVACSGRTWTQAAKWASAPGGHRGEREGEERRRERGHGEHTREWLLREGRRRQSRHAKQKRRLASETCAAVQADRIGVVDGVGAARVWVPPFRWCRRRPRQYLRLHLRARRVCCGFDLYAGKRGRLQGHSREQSRQVGMGCEALAAKHHHKGAHTHP